MSKVINPPAGLAAANILDLTRFVELPKGFAGQLGMQEADTRLELQKLHAQGRIGHDFVVVAPEQAAPSDLQMSLTLRWPAPRHIRWLGIMAAMATARAITPLLPKNVRPEVKFPHNVLIKGRSFQTILVERMAKNLASVTIGVNIGRVDNLSPYETALRHETDVADPRLREHLAGDMLEHLVHTRAQMAKNPLKMLVRLGWTAADGQTTLYTKNGQPVQGQMRGFHDENDDDQVQISVAGGAVCQHPVRDVSRLSPIACVLNRAPR